MPAFTPVGFEQVPLLSKEAWVGDPNANLTDTPALGIDRATARIIGAMTVFDFMPDSGMQAVGSNGFVACAGVIVRDNISGLHTFGHLQPGIRSFERHMKGRKIEDGEAVVVYGGWSSPTNVDWDLRRGDWGSIDTKVISVETGSTWWSMVFKAMTNEILIARQQPDQAILRYRAFED